MSKTLLVSTRKGLFDIRQQGAGKWAVARRSFLGEPVSFSLRDPHDGSLYAALSLGHFGAKLHRSGDEGASWEEISAPSYAGMKADIKDGVESASPPSLKLIWCMETGAPGTLWCGTNPGGLFKSTDRGNSWTLMNNLWDDPLRLQWLGGGYDEPGIHSICVDPRDSNRIAIGISCGGIWLSDDNGEHWLISTQGMWADYMPPEQRENPATQDPHRLVQCRAAPDHFWVQHHNGIFRSTDRCANWTSVVAQPSSFGFAVAVHPQQPNTAWFVPGIKDEKRYPVDGRLVVTRTCDGGSSFTALDQGLPQQDAYDLVYRHGLDVDASGDCLAMASTTGNLWISENGGDSWELFSANLPPVYALRFV